MMIGNRETIRSPQSGVGRTGARTPMMQVPRPRRNATARAGATAPPRLYRLQAGTRGNSAARRCLRAGERFASKLSCARKQGELAAKATECLKRQATESKPDRSPQWRKRGKKKEGSQEMREYPVMLMKTKVDKKLGAGYPVMLMKTIDLWLLSCHVHENTVTSRFWTVPKLPRGATGDQ